MNVCFSAKGLFRGGKKKLDFTWEGEFFLWAGLAGFVHLFVSAPLKGRCTY